MEDDLTVSEKIVKAGLEVEQEGEGEEAALISYLAALPLSLVDKHVIPFLPGTPILLSVAWKLTLSHLCQENMRIACEHAVVGVSAWRVTKG